MDDRCPSCLLVLDEGRRHNCRTRKCPDCGALPYYPHEEECVRLVKAQESDRNEWMEEVADG